MKKIPSDQKNIFTVEQVLEKIQRSECFSGFVKDEAFYLKIEEYQPVLCAAIHNGHQLRQELARSCLLTPTDRFYEEDPYTDEFISSFPITIIGNDSRFEYDLNRPMNQSTYFRSAWDRQVWKRTPSDKQRGISHQKHRAFYAVVESLVAKLEALFKCCLVFDIHSYNFKRHEMDTPTFNIGTEQIDMQRWSTVVRHYTRQLEKISLPNLETRAAVNELFYGRGYLISHINARFDNTLVLPTEIKKVFMDETSGELFPLVLRDLRTEFREAIATTAGYFAKKYTRAFSSEAGQTGSILTSRIDPAILRIDGQLYDLCKGLDILAFINPTNYVGEKRRFLERRGHYRPAFVYRQINIDPFAFRAALYRLPVHQIEDAGLQRFYQEVIDNLADRVGLLTAIGTDRFLLGSLKYYGIPAPALVSVARFIASAPVETGLAAEARVDADAAVAYMRGRAEDWNIPCKIEKSNKAVARMMISHERKTILLSSRAVYTDSELEALAHNQLKVQMVATLNAHRHPLKILSIGLPGYNQTQEGLGIFSEYQSGTLTMNRLRVLAMRVLAVEHMLSDCNFYRTYRMLTEDYGEQPENAFSITSRVYRAGGMTKDYQYLAGFVDMLSLDETTEISLLLSGKVSLDNYSQVREFAARGFIQDPVYVGLLAGKDASAKSPVDYLVTALKQ